MDHTESRTFSEVFEDHLLLSESGEFEADIKRNYSPETIILMGNKVYRGYDGIRELAIRLENEIPNARFQHTVKSLEKDVALLEWTAQSDENVVDDGIDSYYFRDG